jgi:hypothetical protein
MLPHDAALLIASYLTPKTRWEGYGSVCKCLPEQLRPLFTGTLSIQVFGIGRLRDVMQRFPNAKSLQSSGRGKLGEQEARLVAKYLGDGLLQRTRSYLQLPFSSSNHICKLLFLDLTSLDLNGHELSGGLLPLMNSLEGLPRLEKLSIAGNRARPSALQAIFCSGAPIQSLDISGIRLGAAEVEALRLGCPKFAVLKLAGCSLSSKKQSGLKAFIELIPELNQLQQLDLSNNGITEGHFECLCAALLANAASLRLVGLSIAKVGCQTVAYLLINLINTCTNR